MNASPSTPPAIPANLQSQFVFTSYESGSVCSGAIIRQEARLTGECGAAYLNGSFRSQRVSCSTGGVANYVAYMSNDCSGTAVPQNTRTVGVCNNAGSSANQLLSCPAPTTTTTTTTASPTTTTTAPATTTTATSTTTPVIVSNPPPTSGPCFHKDTIITYAGKEYSMEEIRVHSECSIPHIVRAFGVIVTAKCGNTKKTLKLTDGHLLYTQRGLQPAAELKVGQDIVYADIAETVKCQIMSITKETEQHDYFGLNCINNQVLASGLKASTFEKLHSVPAFWMHVIGRVLGIKRASQLGDYIAELVQKMNLI